VPLTFFGSDVVQHSTDQSEPRALRARYVFPVTREPIAGGIVTIEGRQIVAVGSATPAGHVQDLGNVAIVPGLVNAHAHLEFSGLTEPLGRPAVEFPRWIDEVVRFRQEGPYRPRQAVKAGLEESLASGTTTLGEIARPDWHADLFESGPPDTTVFLELIAPTVEEIAPTLELARQHVRSAATPHGWHPGLSPHAPYSVHPAMLQEVATLSAAERIPIAMHLAESPEEMEFLRSGTGPFRDFLERLHLWDPASFLSDTQPIDYLHALAAAHRALVVHGNYLDDEEIAFLAGNADHMAVVYCPRTHAYFQHAEYPLARLLSAGATVALGTDSRASSPDLSLLAEMRQVACTHESIPRHSVLRLGTILGARALGRDHQVGSLEPGKHADLAVIALPDREAEDPHELLFDSDEPVVGAWYRGLKIED
jgi:cytosine/adenosine deaminase-related metal-dependent hydrolase